MSFENEFRKSYILRIEADNLEGATFFNDVITYKPFGNAPPCVEDDPGSNPLGMVYECKQDRYLQVATFQNTEPNTKYFMIVNRRCSPFLNDSTNSDNNGGRRFVRIIIDSGSSSFSGFNNWSIYNLENDSLIKTFNKNTQADIHLGWYIPGEGRLYKLTPVMQEGGTLVADEEVSGDIECKSVVYNNGKNINLLPATTISFTNSEARIIMEGGNFTSGYSSGNNSAPVHLKGKDTSYWKGLILQNCPRVEMLRTYFENISPYELDSTYAAEIVNCRYINIDGCSFRPEPDINAGGVRANFISGNNARLQAYILNNNFEMDKGNIPALSFIASGGITFPLIIENNAFTSGNGNSANAIFLTNINGGAVKDNNITGYKNGVFLLSSSMDFYNNVIDGSYDNSIGFQGYSQSNISMGTSGNYYTAGLNVISAEGLNSKCVYVEKSFFDLHKGENIFDLKNYSSGQEYHLSGWFPNYQPQSTVSAVQNCFRESGTNTEARHNVKWVIGEDIRIQFTEYTCEVNVPEEKILVDLGNNIIDTIFMRLGGSGGGKNNLEFGISNLEFDNNRYIENMETATPESILDSVNINIRKRNYEKVITYCRDFLNDYADSTQSAGLISKLYLAELNSDSTENRLSDLKTLLENLILNHSENEALIKQAFYFIQKCKVSLEEYESAMIGFQQIIDPNPYSYEALVSSWDYSATSLLLAGGEGSGGAISNDKLQISNDESKEDERENSDNVKSQIRNSKSQFLRDDPDEKYDKKAFTKEDRKAIRVNVYHSFETNREKEINIVKTLAKKISEGKADITEKKEFEMKKVLNEIAKPKKPLNISENLSNVNKDINRITETGRSNSLSKNQISMPVEYSLSQNYPNPFNPVTHLEFGIPNPGFVSLKIYDMLGRELKTLVNEIKPAGRFKVDYDGSNFASGVYFYRLEAGDFVQTKRMVLVK